MEETPKGESEPIAVNIERRGDHRVRLEVRAELDSVDNLFARSTNVSASGICVLAPEELPVHSTVDCEFRVPTASDSIEALTEIRWKRPAKTSSEAYVYGLEFIDIPEEGQRRALEQFVAGQTSEA